MSMSMRAHKIAEDISEDYEYVHEMVNLIDAYVSEIEASPFVKDKECKRRLKNIMKITAKISKVVS